METKTLDAIEETGRNLISQIRNFSQAQINTVPFEGSWTAGQVLEHLLKSAQGVVMVVNGPAVPTDRDPDEKSAAIAEMFLNFEMKMKAPAEILPSPPPHRKDALLRQAEEVMDELGQAGITLDITETCTQMELFGFGPLTRLEWIKFSLVHTQRHIHQLKNIHRTISNLS